MMYYLYSIALIAASGRSRLNRLTGLGPVLGLKFAGSSTVSLALTGKRTRRTGSNRPRIGPLPEARGVGVEPRIKS